MLNLASFELAVSFGVKAHTFAFFALRRHAKRTQMTRATRNAGSRRVRFCPSAALTLSKSPKSLRYNFLAPVCRTCLFTSSQVEAVLDLSEIESAAPFEFITQTFAVFRVEVACEARSNDARDAKRMVQGRAGGAESACMAMREACGAEMRRQCAGREVRGGGRVGWAKGTRMAMREACGAEMRVG